MNDTAGSLEAPLSPQAQVIWDGLELRAPTLLGTIDRLEEDEFQWQPPNGANSSPAKFPGKAALVDYFHGVRALTRTRLAGTAEQDFDSAIQDDHFGRMTVRQLWAGVVTSGAWHGGQIVMIANRMLPRRHLSKDAS